MTKIQTLQLSALASSRRPTIAECTDTWMRENDQLTYFRSVIYHAVIGQISKTAVDYVSISEGDVCLQHLWLPDRQLRSHHNESDWTSNTSVSFLNGRLFLLFPLYAQMPMWSSITVLDIVVSVRDCQEIEIRISVSCHVRDTDEFNNTVIWRMSDDLTFWRALTLLTSYWFSSRRNSPPQRSCITTNHPVNLMSLHTNTWLISNVFDIRNLVLVQSFWRVIEESHEDHRKKSAPSKERTM